MRVSAAPNKRCGTRRGRANFSPQCETVRTRVSQKGKSSTRRQATATRRSKIDFLFFCHFFFEAGLEFPPPRSFFLLPPESNQYRVWGFMLPLPHPTRTSVIRTRSVDISALTIFKLYVCFASKAQAFLPQSSAVTNQLLGNKRVREIQLALSIKRDYLMRQKCGSQLVHTKFA